ncbi:SMI1/KNR4 family protein [Streptomyces albus subsp. chlorinus]|nr:SMI1/KNR4 family protein [Streptomyces albus subsp. chlorinus]
MKPLPAGLPPVTESLGTRDVSRQHQAELIPGSAGGRRENKKSEGSSPKPVSGPLTVTEWREFLSDYSSTFLNSNYLRTAESDGNAEYMLSQTQREAGWLGYEPAGEEAVLAAEERLGVRLPPTYRNFLLTSNGWSSIGELDLLKVEENGWFPDLEPQLFQAWSSPGLEFFADDLELLKRCPLISIDGGSGGRWLLHADSAREDGEWTAYEWWPGEGGDLEENDNFAAMVASAVDAFPE